MEAFRGVGGCRAALFLGCGQPTPSTHIDLDVDCVPDGDNALRAWCEVVSGGPVRLRAHLVFGSFQDRERAGKAAAEVREVLEKGETVYFASLTRPERMVLVELYASLAPQTDLADIRKLRPKELQASFLVYRIDTVPLDGVEDAVVYRFARRD